ncbi:peptidoglycan-binding domain-containing protein (plasmid) [Nostoc sp. UHCC 0302]|uniref:peptidoglycan-binding domain-containing protein n=1 Tax=Nostoc sp. UHCC 0302 TaxID=3134896 RepID=UPI00311CE093
MESLAYSYMYMAHEETTKKMESLPKIKFNWKGIFKSFNTVIPNQQVSRNTKNHLPKFQFNWKNLLKSSVWLALAGVSVLVTAVSQIQIASAMNYVSTNGRCLNIRTGPSLNSQVIRCAPYGSSLPGVVRGASSNGFATLADGTYAYSKWINASPPRVYRRSSRINVSSRIFLRNGSQGTSVSQLQKALGNVTVDGYYGPETERQVRSFQVRNGLLVDGIVGPQTRRALDVS